MKGKFNPSLLALAREARGKMQGEVAEQTGISQSMLSKYENDLNAPSDEHLKKIAGYLECPVSFFYRTDVPLAPGTCLYHRKQASLPRMTLRALNARVNKSRMHISSLLDGVTVKPALPFPRMDIADYGHNIPRIAEAVRLAWKLPAGPIRNLIQVIERAGGVVVTMHFDTPKLSAIAHSESPPMFFINSEIPPDRFRYTLAHEIGHLVMHHVPTPDQEKEADSFAAEFLMPARDIKPELSGMSLQKAAELKPLWRASMSSLVRRAKDLNVISGWQYQRMMMDMGRNHWIKCEPVDIADEEPTLLQQLLQRHITDLRYSVSDLACLMDIDEAHLRSEFLKLPSTPRLLQ
jgi:Zn-dependent peptidase ImmA (M78 family)/transcriptional regulator with XRE-family HTH domain